MDELDRVDERMIDFWQILQNHACFFVDNLFVRPKFSPAEQIFLFRILLVAGCAWLRFELRILLFLARRTFVIDFEVMFSGAPPDLAVTLF